MRSIRVHVMPSVWLRRFCVRRHRLTTWYQKANQYGRSDFSPELVGRIVDIIQRHPGRKRTTLSWRICEELDWRAAWNDPAIGIRWPYEGEPQVSAKDALGVGLGGAEVFG